MLNIYNYIVLLSLLFLSNCKHDNKKELNKKNVKAEINQWHNFNESNYSIPIYYDEYRPNSNYGNVYYYSISEYDNENSILYKFIKGQRFKDNKSNFIEISYAFDVITAFYPKYYVRSDKIEDKKVFVNIGIKDISKNNIINDFAYFIMWSNSNKSTVNEINENTDTLKSNLSYDEIQKMYPKFKGKFLKSNVKKIIISNRFSYHRIDNFANNIVFHGDNYINSLLINPKFEVSVKVDSLLSIEANKLRDEFMYKNSRKKDFLRFKSERNKKVYKRHYSYQPPMFCGNSH